VNSNKVALCVLNKNEATNLKNLITKINTSKFDLFFAVDGSSVDDSLNIFNQLGVLVLNQKISGRGIAIRMAIEFSTFHNCDYLILISSDGNEDVNDIERILNLLPQHDLVIASRMLPGSWNEEDSKVFRPRKWVNKIFAYTAYFLLRRKNTNFISDPLNGLRGFKLGFVNSLNLVSKDYAIEFEMSIKSYILGANVIEIPTTEFSRQSGKSMVPPVRTVSQLLLILISSVIKKMYDKR